MGVIRDCGGDLTGAAVATAAVEASDVFERLFAADDWIVDFCSWPLADLDAVVIVAVAAAVAAAAAAEMPELAAVATEEWPAELRI